jgi:hypothetical protein
MLREEMLTSGIWKNAKRMPRHLDLNKLTYRKSVSRQLKVAFACFPGKAEVKLAAQKRAIVKRSFMLVDGRVTNEVNLKPIK